MVKNAPPLPDTEEIDHLLVNDTAFLELLDQFKGSLYTTELQDNPRLRAKFLKEADNDLTKTIKLLRDCLTWRQDMGVDSAISWKFPMVEAIKETYPHRYCGYSREGHPIYMERLGLAHIRQTLTHIPMDDFTRYHILHWEFVHRVLFPIASKRAGHVVDSLVTIVDMSGMGLSLIGKASMEIMRRVAEIDQLYYPESSHQLLIVNAPWIFGAVWSILTPLLNARGHGKISVFYGDSKEALGEFVDDENLPDFLGGELAWDSTIEDRLWVDLCLNKNSDLIMPKEYSQTRLL